MAKQTMAGIKTVLQARLFLTAFCGREVEKVTCNGRVGYSVPIPSGPRSCTGKELVRIANGISSGRALVALTNANIANDAELDWIAQRIHRAKRLFSAVEKRKPKSEAGKP